MATSKEPVRLALRKLWSDHVIWTREYIVAARVAGNARRWTAAGRLQEPGRHRSRTSGYYGQAAGDKLTELLKQHIMIAVDLVAAAKSGDQAAFANSRRTVGPPTSRDVYALPVPIRTGPRTISSTSSPSIWKPTKDEAVARIGGDCAVDVNAFDDIFAEIMVLADAPGARRIVAQFPDRFPEWLGVMQIEIAEKSPEPATLAVGAPGPAFEGLPGHRWLVLWLVVVRRPQRWS